MRVAARAALMLSLMAMGEVVRGEPSLLIMRLRSRRVRPFLDVGALGVVWGVAAAGEGFADGGEAFFLPFLATWAHVDGAGVLWDMHRSRHLYDFGEIGGRALKICLAS